MQPTFIGVFVLLAGLLLLVTASVPAMFSMILACSLMGGSAALLLPALGGSSIPPIQFALAFMLARLLLPGSGQHGQLARSLRLNLLLLCFVAYAILMAVTGPRLFAGQMQVVPLRFVSTRGLFETVPLVFSTQNITSSVYLFGTLAIALSASVACLNPGGARRFVQTGIVIAWIHMFLGVSGVLLEGTPYSDFLALFRNGNYAQTEQVLASFSRIKGISPEPSFYAAFGFAWFVFLFECWYRDVLPRRTGPAAAAMAIVLVFTTSSTAYLGLGAYALILLLRGMFVPAGLPARKAIAIVGAVILALVAVSAILLLMPGFAREFGDMITTMTVGKTGSDSALQRGFWARQGFDAFFVSHGLGIGPGSFRSSSFPTAVLGSTGVAGSALFLVYLLQVVKPFRPSTYLAVAEAERAIGVAASWAALAVMIPAALISPNSDPGPDFAVFAGAALALRASPRRERRRANAAEATARPLPLARQATRR